MIKDKLKVAQIGVGGFGWTRRSLLRQSGLFDLAAVYDHNEETLGRAASEENATAAGSYEELLAFPGIEAVVISTGAKFHAGQIIAAAERGLHVFVEKPLCSTVDEVREILRVQEISGVTIGVGHVDHATDAISRTIRAVIDSGDLGTVTAIEKTTAHSGGHQIKPGDWRGDPEKNPGGMLFQCGVHALHELMFYFGPVAEVSAMMRYDVLPTRTADAATCLLRFSSGMIGTLNAYHTTPYRHTLSIFGSQANLYRDDRYFDEGTRLHTQRMNLTNSKEDLVALPVSGEDDPCGNLRNFYKAVREGGPASPSLRDGAQAVLAVFAAEESAKTGRSVKIGDVLSGTVGKPVSPSNCRSPI
ncbi:MAG: Gfo/Idh/MocA family oxidoreductase [Verrucomicrobiota bacterium]